MDLTDRVEEEVVRALHGCEQTRNLPAATTENFRRPLALLVEAGVLGLVAASDGYAYQEYVLTPKGEALFPVIVTLRQWGEANLFAPREKHSQLIDRASGKLVPKLILRSAGGATPAPAGTFVKKAVTRT
ncbi:winged helix-turn-helix transcriptional regulator [Paraburkholderia sp. BCC1885]|uniref:winged helix-turn-helix transcriptional regulator n=1 Tax=Paraburkholderia sp. BCC1885 TaxID=2562669 RepID=UPI001181E840|nr:winged helix-turn-helix transcriptional regulator [Paraburkholderia sp. BCC1885]